MCACAAGLLVHGGVGYREEPSYPMGQWQMLQLNQLPQARTGRRILLADLHLFDANTSSWSSPELPGYPARKRAFHTLAPLDGRVLVFGGAAGR